MNKDLQWRLIVVWTKAIELLDRQWPEGIEG